MTRKASKIVKKLIPEIIRKIESESIRGGQKACTTGYNKDLGKEADGAMKHIMITWKDLRSNLDKSLQARNKSTQVCT